jgi:hypothetical protein
MDSTQDIILAELRELRSAFNMTAHDTGERLATLETQMHSLCGNGQPGRISLLESAVNKLSAWRWYLLGAAAGVSGVVSSVAWVIVQIRK